jgi:hypothetical protein
MTRKSLGQRYVPLNHWGSIISEEKWAKGNKTVDAHVLQMGHFSAMLLFVFGLHFSSVNVGPMWPHFVNLLARSWDTLVNKTSNNTLGFLLWTAALTVVLWLATVASKAYKRRQDGVANAVVGAFRDSGVEGAFIVAGMIALVIIAWGIAIIPTIFNDHMDMAARNKALAKDNSDLLMRLEVHRHSVVTTDPVFPNLIYMLQAFRTFRNNTHGEPCVIKFTAVPESQDIASLFSQLSIQASNCFTFGPDNNTWMNPDLIGEAKNGTTEGTIVFHANKDDRAANELFLLLSNQIRMQRSYQLPSNPGYELPIGLQQLHTIWFQFGPNVKWNSELRYK